MTRITTPSQNCLLQLDVPIDTAAALMFDLTSLRLEDQAAQLHSNVNTLHHHCARTKAQNRAAVWKIYED